jgi:hypothetical protein
MDRFKFDADYEIPEADKTMEKLRQKIAMAMAINREQAIHLTLISLGWTPPKSGMQVNGPDGAEQERRSLKQRVIELEGIIVAILNGDEGGQGVGFAEAMERAHKAVPRLLIT